MTTNFDQARTYDESQSQSPREEGKSLMKLLAPEKGDKILDIGCGTGYLTQLLAELVGPEGKVIGVDPDVERLTIAREKYAADNIEYLEGTAECLPVPDSEYDIVFVSNVLHFCKDKSTIFRQIAKKLKVGGKLGFLVMDSPKVLETLYSPDIVSQELRTAAFNTIHFIGMEKYREIASKHNFEVLTADKYVDSTKFKDVADLIEFLMTHFHGKFDRTHFYTEAMKQKFGDGEFTIDVDIITYTMKLCS